MAGDMRVTLATEHDNQVAFIAWCALMSRAVPALADVYAIPNGGKRTHKAGRWMAAEGLRRGMPDTVLPHARRGFHHLYVEFKRVGNNASPAQIERMGALAEAGNAVVLVWNWGQARAVVLWYVGATFRAGELASFADVLDQPCRRCPAITLDKADSEARATERLNAWADKGWE